MISVQIMTSSSVFKIEALILVEDGEGTTCAKIKLVMSLTKAIEV